MFDLQLNIGYLNLVTVSVGVTEADGLVHVISYLCLSSFSTDSKWYLRLRRVGLLSFWFYFFWILLEGVRF